MNKIRDYKAIEIPGSFLVQGFSIYVLEIIKDEKKWFYIGMTGDSYYPSARAAFYRLIGHFDSSVRSTQNQLLIAMKEQLEITEEDIKDINIKMHHFPIPGFVKITYKQLNNDTMKQLIHTKSYKDYKNMQQQVLALENALIFKLKEKLLNKTKGKSHKTDKPPYLEIYKSIISLVNNE